MINVEDKLWNQVALKMQYTIKAINNGVLFQEFSTIDLHNVYLMTSLAYYKHNRSYISDISFDKLCKYMLDNYNEFVSVVRHPEKLLTKDDLMAGTGFALEYPGAIHHILDMYMRLP